MASGFDKVLVANRGEIAVRVMRALRDLGMCSVAVFSEADREALHVRYADEAYCIGPAASTQSYLVQDAIIAAARQAGAQAVHPGYGFLSERAEFARAIEDAGLCWIGPPPSAIEAMGDKIRARELMLQAGVRVVPGTPSALQDPASALAAAQEIGFPVLIKAAAGGGGKGMRRVDAEADFARSFAAASREAEAAFGRGDCYVEKLLIEPKHVEVQVLCDKHGGAVHLFERDCSVQRRHQKVIEETPCPVLESEVREQMGELALRAARAVSYVSAGTVEFLLDADHTFYFLEMNTRLQVEHPVTEWVTGLDLVELQLEVAQGEPLPFEQADVTSRGASIEARIYAEDPANNFLPSPGQITRLRMPSGPGVRVDSGVYEGCTVPMYYDPLLAKLTVWAGNRNEAIRRMGRALSELYIGGIRCNTTFLRRILSHPDFATGTYDIGFVERDLAELTRTAQDAHLAEVARLAGLAAANRATQERASRIDGRAGGDGATSASHSQWQHAGRLRQLN